MASRSGHTLMRRWSSALCGAAVLLASGGLDAQPTFKSGIDAVRLDVAVLRRGQPVAGLTARDFSVLDNGVRQGVADVTLEEYPLSVVMVLDTSGSMAGGRLQHLIDAARGLLASLKPTDAASLITFSEDVQLRVPLTRDRRALGAALDRLSANGPTSMRDALWTALQLRHLEQTRPLALLFSDGIDTASWLSFSDLLTATERADTTVHIVELLGERTATPAFGRFTPPPNMTLDRLANAGGGRKWSATSSSDLRELFTHAIGEMRARYLLTFYPEGPQAPGWHELKVTVNRGGDVTTRPGYFVP